MQQICPKGLFSLGLGSDTLGEHQFYAVICFNTTVQLGGINALFYLEAKALLVSVFSEVCAGSKMLAC